MRLWRSWATALALLGLAATAARAEPVTVTFLHSNDVYEMAPKDGAGGFAPFMTLLRAERARNPNTVTTFGGDLLSPSLLSGLTRGAQMVELMNAIGVQVAVLGNHEFDFGPRVTAERVAAARFPWLGANVRDRDGKPAAGAADTKLIEVGGYRVGFLGLLTPQTAALSSPGGEVAFAAPRAAAEAAVKRLKDAGADLVVALTHQDLADDRALVRAVDGIDVVLGGHDHDPITFYEGGKLIVKTGHDLGYLAAVDLVVDRVQRQGKQVVAWRPAWRYLSTAGVAPDPEVQAIVAGWERRLDADLARPVGRAAVDLDTRRASVRTRETNFGDLVADALRAATNADAALANGGGIRGDRLYPAGAELTRKDIQTELPFGNVVVLLEVKGSDLLAALENGVSQVEAMAGRFPQVSGLRFAWNAKAPPGSRVKEASVAGAPLDPARTYRLATSDYLFGGGDGYASLTNALALIDASGGRLIVSAVIDHVASLGGTIALAPDGRVARVD